MESVRGMRSPDSELDYETFRSTLTEYPRTLLGTMFAERNKDMLKPDRDEEYFFDRDGHIFHYIMEFYRKGKIPWEQIAESFHSPLQEELEYFQIDCPPVIMSPLDEKFVSMVVEDFKRTLVKLLEQSQRQFVPVQAIHFYPGLLVPSLSGKSSEPMMRIAHEFRTVGFEILKVEKARTKIQEYISALHPIKDCQIIPVKGKNNQMISYSIQVEFGNIKKINWDQVFE
ncbi:hypothetical protein G9A89_001565 [Geosiphon pyriformis]|nr:hypothetical protein G9A89_001565 [Geosiphon pyriformis]